MSNVPYSEDEAREAWLFVNKHGPSNAWTGTGGTAARIIGRLLGERTRLMSELDKATKQGERTMVAATNDYFSATKAAKELGCSRSSVCRVAKNYGVGIFANGRLAALTKNDLVFIKEHVHDSSGNPNWIAARGQKIRKAGKKKKGY